MSLPLPAGGAMTIAEYGHVDLFRSGVLSNIKFGEDRTLYG